MYYIVDYHGKILADAESYKKASELMYEMFSHEEISKKQIEIVDDEYFKNH